MDYFQNWIIVVFLILSLHVCATAAEGIDDNYEWHYCGKTGNYTPNSAYDNNLNTLLSSLSNNVNQYGFYNGSVGQGSDRASAIVLCRGDVEPSVCSGCVSDNAVRIKQLCPNQNEAFRWYNICSIYYSNESIIGSLHTTPEIQQNSLDPVPNPAQFNQDLTSLVDRLRTQAVNGRPVLKYAANSTAGPDSQTIYAYVQCTPDLSVRDCNDCLNTAFALWNNSEGNGKIGARVLRPSCFFRYEISTFFGASLISGSQPPQTAPPPTPPPPPPSKVKWFVVVAVIVALVMVTIFVCIVLRKRRKRRPENGGIKEERESQKLCRDQIEESSSCVEISTVESLLKFQLSTLQNANENFSKANKTGEGGFGIVYKGKLENNQLVAVKRLSENSRQGNLEFKNEVDFIAKLRHKNLVKLHGYCQEGREMILVYEFVSNGGLDDFLFGRDKHQYLDWERRYIIIESIASGLIYLHNESSPFRIIHRDLKASNILLDENLNPKITDFGMARLFALNQTQASTITLVGSQGYIAPEYARFGIYSDKSDLYSFGVLVLEIISGQRNTIQSKDSRKDLLFEVWTEWEKGSTSNVIDRLLKVPSSPMKEIKRCIHVALLCVQVNAVDRPKMSEVHDMLNRNYLSSMKLPKPSVPGFYTQSSVNS